MCIIYQGKVVSWESLVASLKAIYVFSFDNKLRINSIINNGVMIKAMMVGFKMNCCNLKNNIKLRPKAVIKPRRLFSQRKLKINKLAKKKRISNGR
jgi:hypothetical protein